MNTDEPNRIDRRMAIKWMLTAGAGAMLSRRRGFADAPAGASPASPVGYGTDPDLVKPYKPGDYWPLTFSDAQRREAAVLCDIVIPAEGGNPSASSVGVVDFVDEWVSAPYPQNVADRAPIMDGLAWLDAESGRRFGAPFANATAPQRLELCEAMAQPSPRETELGAAHEFFRLFRDLTASGYFTTPDGMKDLGYVGNVPLARFDGPPAELVAKLGLTDEVKW